MDEYVGPTIAEEYLIKNDSLFRIKNGQSYQVCIKNRAIVLLTNHLGRTYKWERLNTALKISDWSLDQDSLFDAEFLKREREFNK